MTTPTEATSGEFRYAVTVRAETAEQAATVLAQRLGHDDDYGFEYAIVEFAPMADTATAGVLGWPEVSIPNRCGRTAATPTRRADCRRRWS